MDTVMVDCRMRLKECDVNGRDSMMERWRE